MKKYFRKSRHLKVVFFTIAVLAMVFLLILLINHLGQMRAECDRAYSNVILEIVALLLLALSLTAWATLRLYREQIAHARVLQESNRKLKDLVVRDGLTGVYNHRYFEDELQQEWRRMLRLGHKLSCVMLDIDNFKKINDTYGHSAGDLVLRKIAEILHNELRDIDIVSRYGGEEFTAILFEKPTTHKGLLEVMERVRKNIEEERFEYDGQIITVTASLGGAMAPDKRIITALELVKMSDKAMYAAKKAGKNCVRVFE